MKLLVTTSQKQYPIILENGALQNINKYINTHRNIYIITDEGVPVYYVETVRRQCLEKSFVFVAPGGERAKSFAVYEEIITSMLEHQINRHDAVIAIGGGVIGDLAGFVSSTYMRGISFVNIPTTTLSQIDSSIGGKVAINVGHTKNIVGSFYPPDCVIIDPDTLSTLPLRHYHNGLVEAIKAGLLANPNLLQRFESTDLKSQINDIIYEALLVKKTIVEADEKEANERKLLNLGHTIGHALESYHKLSQLLHGEAVAVGMLPMIENEQLKQRIERIFQNMNIKTSVPFDKEQLTEYITRDKKVSGTSLSVIVINDVAKPQIRNVSISEISDYIDRLLPYDSDE